MHHKQVLCSRCFLQLIAPPCLQNKNHLKIIRTNSQHVIIFLSNVRKHNTISLCIGKLTEDVSDGSGVQLFDTNQGIKSLLRLRSLTGECSEASSLRAAFLCENSGIHLIRRLCFQRNRVDLQGRTARAVRQDVRVSQNVGTEQE